MLHSDYPKKDAFNKNFMTGWREVCVCVCVCNLSALCDGVARGVWVHPVIVGLGGERYMGAPWWREAR